MALLRMRPRPVQATQPDTVTGTLVAFYADKGYGFITPDDRSKDIMVRRDVLLASGVLDIPKAESRIQCVVEQTERGPYATRVLFVTAHMPSTTPGVRGPEVMTVKFFDPLKGFGFLRREDGVNVYLHASVVKKASIDALRPEEQLKVWYAPGKSGFQATQVRMK